HACEALHKDAETTVRAAFADSTLDALWCRDFRKFAYKGHSVHQEETPSNFEEFLLWNPRRISSYGFVVRRQSLQSLARRFPEGKGYVFSALLWRYCHVMQSDAPICYCNKPIVEMENHIYLDMLQYLQNNPLFCHMQHDGQDFHFLVCSLRDGIHWHIINGFFPERKELRKCAEMLQKVTRTPVIYDIGTNIGTHSVYFAKVMKALRVIPFDISPLAITHYRANMRLNTVADVVLDDHMGIGLGAEHAVKRLDFGHNPGVIGNWRASDTGVMDVQIRPLDSFDLPAPDLLKIDVEGMEMEVLQGAKETITRNRPHIFIEVGKDNIPQFDTWVRAHNYTIFEDVDYRSFRNFLLHPQEQKL
ncbi:MAG: FkbM family methyltransferase, partial [Pseudomonadota bacterium]